MRSERGQISAEFSGGLLLVALIIAVLVASGAPTRIADGVADAICRISGQACGSAAGENGHGESADALADRLAGVAPFATVQGGALEALADAARSHAATRRPPRR